jgi:hypothetical protein
VQGNIRPWIGTSRIRTSVETHEWLKTRKTYLPQEQTIIEGRTFFLYTGPSPIEPTHLSYIPESSNLSDKPEPGKPGTEGKKNLNEPQPLLAD